MRRRRWIAAILAGVITVMVSTPVLAGKPSKPGPKDPKGNGPPAHATAHGLHRTPDGCHPLHLELCPDPPPRPDPDPDPDPQPPPNPDPQPNPPRPDPVEPPVIVLPDTAMR